MSPIQSVSIVGLGWLGMPLAQRLAALGYRVAGSKTSPEGIAQARALGIEAIECRLTPALETPAAPLTELLKADLVIVNIPPGRRRNNADYHIRQIAQLIEMQQALGGGRWLFVSSTSVYGNENRLLTEADPPSPVTESGKALARIEQLLQEAPAIEATVLRFAGLVGGERQPGRFLSGKRVSGARQPVNLLHRDDCIGIIERLIERNLWGELFNACADEHPTRQAFYEAAARAMGLPAPEFEPPELPDWKLIDNQRLKQRLGYRLLHPDPLNWF